MGFHKSILVSCHIQDSPQAIPLATSILKAYSSDLEGLNIELFNLYLNQKIEHAADSILEKSPHSVGFSMYIWNRSFVEKMASIIKNKNRDIIIFTGGAEVTASFEEISKNPHFDYIIPGEGEIPFKKLMSSFVQKEIQIDNKIFKKEHIKDLELIPSPFLTGTLDPSSWDGILWELSRGCPFNCAFCSESRGIDGVRYFDENRIIEELKLFEEKKVEQVWVLDPTFNINKKRALRILSLIEEHAPLIHYTFEIRAELLDEEMAKAFSEIHCSLQIGLQSSHIHVLEKLNRKINMVQFAEKIGYLNKFGAVFGLDLIYGLPLDNFNGFMESLDFALYQIPNHLDIFRLSIFPGTELYDKASELQIDFLKNTPYSVVSTPDYNGENLLKSEKIALAVDVFYNKGRSAPWLLSVSEFLELRPSTFIEKFASYMKKVPESTTDIFKFQNEFVTVLCNELDKSSFLPIILDIIQFHFLYSEALHNMPAFDEPLNHTINLQNIYKVSSSLKTGKFFYDVTIYSESGMIDIDHFSLNHYEEDSFGMIFNNGNEILTMAIDKSYFDFICSVDEKSNLQEILSLINVEPDEIKDFIEFLIEANLLIPVEK